MSAMKWRDVLTAFYVLVLVFEVWVLAFPNKNSWSTTRPLAVLNIFIYGLLLLNSVRKYSRK
jgi:hypothetical protein